MKELVNILIVDDHPMIIEAYRSIIASAEMSNFEINIDTAGDADSGMSKIRLASKTTPYDIVFLDIKIPPSSDGTVVSGEDLAVYAKKFLPNTKVAILTMHNEHSRIQTILEKADPDGFMVKNDLTPKEFAYAFDAILKRPPYYSATVSRHLRNSSVIIDTPLLDDVNRKILYYLSEGVQTKNLTSYVNISLSSIEKRKIQIKNVLNLERSNDKEMIAEAKKRGLL